MFEIKVIKYFHASHGLRNFKGSDESVHEHHWRLEVVLQGKAIDASGCLVDFHDVDQALEKLIAPYQGKAFNDVEPFLTQSPSAEAIAKHFFETFSRSLPKTLTLGSFTVCEDDHHCATYKL